jgi:hypothetical protein
LKLRELFIACQPLPAIAFVINGASFQKFECLNLIAYFSHKDISPEPPFLYNHGTILSRLRHLISGSGTCALSVFGDIEMMSPFDISDTWGSI